MPVVGIITVSSDGLSATFMPNGGLTTSTNYFVRVFGVIDLTSLDVNFFWTSRRHSKGRAFRKGVAP